jgi:hypothetical protein
MDTIDRYGKPGVHQAYRKTVDVIMKCKTEEQLKNAGRCLRNYERLVSNSYLYPNISKAFTRRTTNDLLSLIKLKGRAFNDL